MPEKENSGIKATDNNRSVANNASGTGLSLPAVPVLVQRQTKNNTGMPDKLKSGLENLSGMDLSGVSVHYNSPKPAQLQALAFAQGNSIHIGPGQEKHLPHEGWHVVQQMQGRVAPTMQLKGIQVNDDDALEREADVMGGKAAGYETAGGVDTHAPAYQLRQEPGMPSAIVQRAMGFEFESSENIFEEAYPRKHVVYESPNITLEADGDGRNMEFVTKPKQKYTQVLAAVDEAATLAQGLVDARRDAAKVTKEKAGYWQHKTVMFINDGNFLCFPQHTEGVALEDMMSFIRDNYRGIRRRHLAADDPHQIPDDNAVANSLELTEREIYAHAEAAGVHPRVRGLIQAIVMFIKNARGLPTVITSKEGPKPNFPLMARTDFKSMFDNLDTGLPTARARWAAKGIRNPCNKESFYSIAIEKGGIAAAVGLRNDEHVFSESYVAAEPEGAGITLKGDGINNVNRLLENAVPDMVRRGNIVRMNKPFFDGDGAKVPGPEWSKRFLEYGFDNGPTLGAWLQSIVKGSERDHDKDEMSPPTGLPRHKDTPQRQRYGMGAYGMDNESVPGTPLALYEMRYHTMVGGQKGYAEWHAWAEAIIRGAAARKLTDDRPDAM